MVSCIFNADGHDRALIMALVNDGEVTQLGRHVGKTMRGGGQCLAISLLVLSVTTADILPV